MGLPRIIAFLRCPDSPRPYGPTQAGGIPSSFPHWDVVVPSSKFATMLTLRPMGSDRGQVRFHAGPPSSSSGFRQPIRVFLTPLAISSESEHDFRRSRRLVKSRSAATSDIDFFFLFALAGRVRFSFFYPFSLS